MHHYNDTTLDIEQMMGFYERYTIIQIDSKMKIKRRYNVFKLYFLFKLKYSFLFLYLCIIIIYNKKIYTLLSEINKLYFFKNIFNYKYVFIYIFVIQFIYIDSIIHLNFFYIKTGQKLIDIK